MQVHGQLPHGGREASSVPTSSMPSSSSNRLAPPRSLSWSRITRGVIALRIDNWERPLKAYPAPGAESSGSGRGQRGQQHGPQAALAGLAKGLQGGGVPRSRYFAGL